MAMPQNIDDEKLSQLRRLFHYGGGGGETTTTMVVVAGTAAVRGCLTLPR